MEMEAEMMRAADIFDEVKKSLQRRFKVRTSLQEVPMRIENEIYLEVDSIRMEPAEFRAYEWIMSVRCVGYADRDADAVALIEDIMLTLETGQYSADTFYVEYGTMNATGTAFEVEVMFTLKWVGEVSKDGALCESGS